VQDVIRDGARPENVLGFVGMQKPVRNRCGGEGLSGVFICGADPRFSGGIHITNTVRIG
jgi:hypothetical protein